MSLLNLILGILIVWLLKPRIFFKPNGNLRLYGFGYDEEGYKKTIYTFHIFVILFAVFLSTK